MRKTFSFLIFSCIISSQISAQTINEPTKSEITAPFLPFAGKITKNKVRMRLSPTLDSMVLRELNKDDLFVVVSEMEDFYAVEAPADIKAYVYRTFILDNIVEGNHVNVRLEPSIEAPVVVQLNSGDTVDGKISQINSKWMEIALPKTAKFYISKDFIEKIGEPALVETISKRRESINRLLESTYQIAEVELQKPFQQIQMDGIFQNLNKIIGDNNSMAEQKEKASAMLTSIQDKYLQRKIAFLEEKPAQVIVTRLQNENDNRQANSFSSFNMQSDKFIKNSITAKMMAWLPAEETIYSSWIENNPDLTQEQFYQNQKQEAVTISGLIEAYDGSIKNKPGDYVLVNSVSHLPIAYIYSTLVNLQDMLGEVVVLEAAPRPNNNFAFPAYFVIGIAPKE